MPQLTVHLVYAKSPNEIFNRRAALGSAIRTIAQLLTDLDYQVILNGAPFSEVLEASSNSTPEQIKSLWAQKCTPQIVVNGLRDLRQFKRHHEFQRKILRSGRGDVVFEVYSYGSKVGLELAGKMKAPLVLLYDAPVSQEYEWLYGRSPVFKKLIDRREIESVTRADLVIVYSDLVQDYLVQNYGVPSQRIRIHQSVDFTRLEVPEHQKRFDRGIQILYLGSFLKWHQIPSLLKSFESVRRKGMDCRLILAGDGMEASEVKSQMNRMDFRRDVEMTGYIDGNELIHLKKSSHIGVVPGSNWYGAPVKIFEYGAAGLAVIAPDTPTISYLQKSGLSLTLFDSQNKDGLANQLEHLLKNKDEILQKGRQLRNEVVERYSYAKDLQFYKSTIQSVSKRPN